MKKISSEISYFLQDQGYVLVSTLDEGGGIHCSAKGVIAVEEPVSVYLIDLYRNITYANLQRNPTLSITAIDDNQFIGFTLKGKARIVKRDKMKDKIVKQWEKKIVERISKRVVKDIKKDKSSIKHPEAKFPQPQYLIKMRVNQIIDLTPSHLKNLSLDN